MRHFSKHWRVFLCLLSAGTALSAQDAPDPYRWLEEGNSPKVQQWVQAQDHKTEAYLSKIPGRDKLEARLKELYSVDSISLPRQAGERLFYKRITTGHEQPAFLAAHDGNNGGASLARSCGIPQS